MKNFFGFGAAPEIEIVLDGQDSRRTAEIKNEDGKKERHLLYYDGETVSGKVKVLLKKPNSKFEHQGIRIELIGQIEFYYDRGTQYTFLSLFKELARPGDLLPHQQFNFDFHKVEKPFESYTGANCKLRYFLRLSIAKRLSDVVKEREIIVHTLSQFPDMNSSIKMEVGIEDCLHIEFEYNRSKYHLKDVIVGKIYFLLVRIKIKHMELAIIKRETTGSGPNTFNENETIAKFEIMDGAPVKGESIPIRVFLAGYDLTPTFRDVNRKFSVRYYLNLVLVDEEDRRYFKQQEIVLWRKIDKPRKTFQAALQQQFREMQNPNVQFTGNGEPVAGPSRSYKPKNLSSEESDCNDEEMTNVIGEPVDGKPPSKPQSESGNDGEEEEDDNDSELEQSVDPSSASGAAAMKMEDRDRKFGKDEPARLSAQSKEKDVDDGKPEQSDSVHVNGEEPSTSNAQKPNETENVVAAHFQSVSLEDESDEEKADGR